MKCQGDSNDIRNKGGTGEIEGKEQARRPVQKPVKSGDESRNEVDKKGENDKRDSSLISSFVWPAKKPIGGEGEEGEERGDVKIRKTPPENGCESNADEQPDEEKNNNLYLVQE